MVSVCVGHEREGLVRGCIVADWERKMCGGRACVGMKKRGAGLGREKSKPGVRQLFVFGQEGATGWFERDEFLGLGFFVFSPDVQNCPPLCMCWKLIFIGKNVVRSPNLVPQLLLFFC